MFIIVLFIIANNRKQPNCPSGANYWLIVEGMLRDAFIWRPVFMDLERYLDILGIFLRCQKHVKGMFQIA